MKCIFNHILESGAYPDEWKAKLTPIYKGKGNPDEEGNYRGLSVAGTLAKMYGSILGNRLRKYLINNNNRRLVTLAEHTSDHGRQTNSSTEEKGEQV